MILRITWSGVRRFSVVGYEEARRGRLLYRGGNRSSRDVGFQARVGTGASGRQLLAIEAGRTRGYVGHLTAVDTGRTTTDSTSFVFDFVLAVAVQFVRRRELFAAGYLVVAGTGRGRVDRSR